MSPILESIGAFRLRCLESGGDDTVPIYGLAVTPRSYHRHTVYEENETLVINPPAGVVYCYHIPTILDFRLCADVVIFTSTSSFQRYIDGQMPRL